MINVQQDALKSILSFYADSGVETLTGDMPVDSKSTPKMEPQAQPTPKVSEPPKASFTPAEQQPSLMPTQPSGQNVDLSGVKTLEELSQAIRDYDGIGLKKTAMNMVFADGDPNSDIMVIGEAPGADEDRQGKPFVGRAGQLLDKMLAAINMGRAPSDDQHACYISNIINWRPPGNRTPTPEEISASLPFIQKHIELVQPKMIFLMGAVAAKSLLGKSEGISKLRGKVWDQGDIKIIATYHPAYLLRQPLMKRKAWADLLMAQEIYQDLTEKGSS